jgi:hypothetical protein
MGEAKTHGLIATCPHCGHWFYVTVAAAELERFEATCAYCFTNGPPRCRQLGHSFKDCGFEGGMTVTDLAGEIISPGDPTFHYRTPIDEELWG